MSRARAVITAIVIGTLPVVGSAVPPSLAFVSGRATARLDGAFGGGGRRIGDPHAPAPVLIVETTKGSFTIQTFPNDAPKTVAHVVALAKNHFYDGQRIHRALKGFVVQFGDPQSRDLAKRDLWGLGPAASSGKPVGVSEITPKRTHAAGAVGLAHMGEPAKGDSQIYITLAPRHELDGKYAVFGQVVEGADVPASLEVGDEIRQFSVRE